MSSLPQDKQQVHLYAFLNEHWFIEGNNVMWKAYIIRICTQDLELAASTNAEFPPVDSKLLTLFTMGTSKVGHPFSDQLLHIYYTSQHLIKIKDQRIIVLSTIHSINSS